MHPSWEDIDDQSAAHGCRQANLIGACQLTLRPGGNLNTPSNPIVVASQRQNKGRRQRPERKQVAVSKRSATTRGSQMPRLSGQERIVFGLYMPVEPSLAYCVCGRCYVHVPSQMLSALFVGRTRVVLRASYLERMRAGGGGGALNSPICPA